MFEITKIINQKFKNINDKKAWFGYILTFILLANMKFNGLVNILTIASIIDL